MKKLKLPVIKDNIPEPRSLSMDEYAKFVEFNLRYTVDIETLRKQKREMIGKVVPFRLK